MYSVKGFMAKRVEKWIIKNPEISQHIIEMANSGMSIREIKNTLKAEMDVKKLKISNSFQIQIK